MSRGLVVPLTWEDVVTRALYLAGKLPITALDKYVRRIPAELRLLGYADISAPMCPDLFYLLKNHNGGKDPTAPDPADRWSVPGSIHQNRTADCVGGAAWCSGFDRYQPDRMPDNVGYDGWFNTDSMRIDAANDASCFERLDRPEPGCLIVCASGSYGHTVGHVGVVVAVHCLEWDPKVRDLYELVDVVDVAARRFNGSPSRANKMTSARGWYGADPWFLRSVMTP